MDGYQDGYRRDLEKRRANMLKYSGPKRGSKKITSEQLVKILCLSGGILVGSRALGLEKEVSDWDAAFTDKYEFDRILESLGRNFKIKKVIKDGVDIYTINDNIDVFLVEHILSPVEQLELHLQE